MEAAFQCFIPRGDGWSLINGAPGGLSRFDDRSESGYFPAPKRLPRCATFTSTGCNYDPTDGAARQYVISIPKKRMVSPFFVTAAQNGSRIVCLVTGRPRG
jgi:hypothetical protein